MHYIALVIFFLLPALSFSADCKQLTSDLAKKFHPKLDSDSHYHIVCKVWPYSPDKTLVAMALPSDIVDKKYNDKFYDLDVFVLRTDNHAVIGHLYEKKVFADGPFFTDKLAIDTARYQLNSESRAFGVLFHKTGHGDGRAYSEYILSLYYLKDKTVHRVLTGLSTAKEIALWERESIECNGTFKRTSRAVILDSKQTFGFNDLKIKVAVEKLRVTGADPNDCGESLESLDRSSFTLKYNGKKYVLPKKSFGDGFDPEFWNVNP